MGRYMDDLIFGSNNDEMSHKFGQEMSKEFEMSMIGQLSFFLGLQVTQTNARMFIAQSTSSRCLSDLGWKNVLL